MSVFFFFTLFSFFILSCLCSVRLLEQQVKGILDAIATDGGRKRELIRGDAVDKAEQLSEGVGRGVGVRV